MGDKLRILLTGGGSGGHVYPLIAVAGDLRRLADREKINLEMVYLGPEDAYSQLFKDSGVSASSMPAGKIRRYLSPLMLIDIPKLFLSFLVALFKVYFTMPDAAFSKGGTGALPVVFACWFYGIPVIIHESDASPGMNNLLSSHLAKRIAVSFESALKYFNAKKVALVGTPIRQELVAGAPSQKEAKEYFGFDPGQPLTLVMGGSLGSERINKFILTNLASMVAETQVLHQTGKLNFAETEKLSRAALMDLPVKAAAKTRYKAVPYFADDLGIAFSAADLVVSRAGSGTIFEAAAFGKPMILIPLLESANGHQRANAYEVMRGEGAIVIEEQNLLPAIFIAQIKSILGNSETSNKMSGAMKNFFKPQAAEIIAQELLRFIK